MSSTRTLHGPSIAAVALWGAGKDELTQLLTEEERAQLSVIASVVRFKKGTVIFREGDLANAVFNIVDGVVKTYRGAANNGEHIGAFLFADDLFGLAEAGNFVNSAKAVTDVTAYRFPVTALEARLRKDAALEFHVICKLCHELRDAQRHAFLLARRNALARIALFFQLIELHQTRRREGTEQLALPMSRSDIADYVGMSPEAVSRSFRTMASRGIVRFISPRLVQILDPDRLEALILPSSTGKKQLTER